MAETGKLKKSYQTFKRTERKVSVVFFWCCLLGFVALMLNKNLFDGLNIKRLVGLMLIVGTVGYLGFYLFRRAYHKKQWHRFLVPVIAQIKQHVTAKRVITAVFVLLAIYLAKTSFAAYQIQPLTTPSHHEGHWLLTPHFNISTTHGDIANTQSQRGYYGVGLSFGYQTTIGCRHQLAWQLGFNHNSKSTFTDRTGKQFSTSLFDADVLGSYQYRLLPSWSLGGLTGIAFAYGFNDSPQPAVHFYRNLLPIAGVVSGFRISDHLLLNIDYLHYFGCTNAYQSKSGLPSIDRLSIGVTYVF